MSKNQNAHIAAIDMGSNSFHMAIAEEGDVGNIMLIDRVKEMVRLGSGLDEQGYLTEQSQRISLACLERFSQRLQHIPRDRIRAVATNTLRVAKNRDAFLKKAEHALQHPISVISGYEEARLVYLGAAFDLAVSNNQRLVVDIGGGSTELIIGHGYQPELLDSLNMGCVSLTKQCFSDGLINQARFDWARNLALAELEPVVNKYLNHGWQETIGTSGTIKSIVPVIHAIGIKQDWLCMDSLSCVKEWMFKRGHVDRLHAVSDRRRAVFAGGFVVLWCVFEALQIERMDISQGALREGVIYDLNGRLHHNDSRFQGIASLAARFKVDQQQADRVENLARKLLSQLADHWDMQILDKYILRWAARVHEIGVAVSYDNYHDHGAYIIENSDIDGFSKQIQRVLAQLVKNHRQKIDITWLPWLPEEWQSRTLRLTVILRLAVTFLRGRHDANFSDLLLHAQDKHLRIKLPKDWIQAHPLTIFDLKLEQGFLAEIGFDLEIDQID